VEKPQVITPAPEPKKETPVVQAGKPAEPAVSEPPKAEAKAGGSKPETPDGPQPKPAAPASQKFWMDMFAEVKEISIDVKAVGVKEGQKTQGQAQGQPPIVGEITKKFTFALTDLGLQVAKTDKAVLRVEVTARLDEMGFNIVSLAGKLDCREGNAAPITVWSHNDDLTKFHPKNVPPNLDSLWRTDVADFVGQFTRDYKKAVNTVNESRRKG
jgi:hypothetical protein